VRAVALCAAVLLLGAAGCASSEDGDVRDASGSEGSATDRTALDRSPDERSADHPGRERGAPDQAEVPALDPATCPPGTANCRTASGSIVYVERVDPDGDGDAHFVLLSRQSITAPGVSVIDVKRSLRPSPLPGPGDRISAAGPVYRGSHGQRQIEAIEVNVARDR
jgi:hypothetical protein